MAASVRTAPTCYGLLTAAVTNSFEEHVGSIKHKLQTSLPCLLLFNPIMLRLLQHFGSGFSAVPDSQVRTSTVTLLTVWNEKLGLQVWGVTPISTAVLGWTRGR